MWVILARGSRTRTKSRSQRAALSGYPAENSRAKGKRVMANHQSGGAPFQIRQRGKAHFYIGRVDLGQQNLLRLQAAQLAQLFFQAGVLFVHVEPQAESYRRGAVQFNNYKTDRKKTDTNGEPNQSRWVFSSDLEILSVETFCIRVLPQVCLTTYYMCWQFMGGGGEAGQI